MEDDAVLAAAELAGLEIDWLDAAGRSQRVSIEALRRILEALGDDPDPALLGPPMLVTCEAGRSIELTGVAGSWLLKRADGSTQEGFAEAGPGGRVLLPAIDDPGYHLLEIGGCLLTLAVAPPSAWTVADATTGRRVWGLTAQLYSLRRENDAGLGDFTALRELAEAAGKAGAAALAISPVHAQFAADPGRFSAYSPSSRTHLNWLYADPGGFSDEVPVGAEDGLIDWSAAAQVRTAAMRRAFAQVMEEQGQLLERFREFRIAGGEALERHARFEALQVFRSAQATPELDWRQWDFALRRPESDAVALFAAEQTKEVAFHAFAQFTADSGLAAAQWAAREAGMEIGLIADIAVGVSPAGSDAWSRQGEMLAGLAIGAPPDILNPQGQNWGVTGFAPRRLAQNGYAGFIALLRASLRHAGGIRIDHAMGLRRLWVIPDGADPADGAYLQMPQDDLLRLIRLESWLHRAIVIGEDLGTVPAGFRERLDVQGLAGMRVLWFEREADEYVPPAAWPSSAVAMTSTHDLPTVAGWWRGRDIEWRHELGMDLGPTDETVRARDRKALWQGFRDSGSAADAPPTERDIDPVVDAAVTHIARSGCVLALVPLEDLAGISEQPNLPGTVAEHPNWRRRLPDSTAGLFAAPAIAARLSRLKAERE